MKRTSPLPSPKSSRPSGVSTSQPPRHSLPTDVAKLPAGRPRLRRISRKNSASDDIESPVDEPSLTPTASFAAGHATAEGNISTTSESAEEETDDSESVASDQKDYDEGKSPEQLEIQRLKQALNDKMAANQQRAKVLSSPRASPDVKTPVNAGARKFSPIKEEGVDMSPSLEASFSSPMATTGPETSSTESTESARTIRGSMPPTPAQQLPLRTPSYPFPYVPGTPRTWSSSFHQPFTSLSPTVATANLRDQPSTRDHFASGESTPAGSVSTFLAGDQSLDDSQYPSPNLYDIILQLNSEPGLDAWWPTVVRICHEWFGAERAILAVPADASDQNVPWCQQASFDSSGKPDNPPAHQTRSFQPEIPFSTEPETAAEESDTIGSLPSGKRRPKLESRHSYAGHERQRKEVVTELNSKIMNRLERPGPPSRTASHAPRTLSRGDHPLRHVSPATFDGTRSPPRNNTTFSDPDFSSIGDVPERPYVSLFSQRQALSYEMDPLIDNTGVNRILERGKLVTLTRDYSSVSGGSDSYYDAKQGLQLRAGPGKHPVQNNAESQRDTRTKPSLASRASAFDAQSTKRPVPYEEYEQFPSSPWAQSPAPSPAIQHDANENPFFGKGSVDETSFEPSTSSNDYSKMEAVEAIGVDKASTVTHIPFIHPILSQVSQPFESAAYQSSARHESRISRAGRPAKIPMPEDNSKTGRKTPIAILSILSSAVPFPHNWTQSLKLLAPHLATSFSNAAQYTEAQKQAQNLRNVRFGGPQLLSADTESLTSLLKLDMDTYSESAPGSMTSPSDYSGRSRQSPGSNSVVGTPAWDTSALNMAGRHSVSSTPAIVNSMETIDSYFESKKKLMGARSGSGSSHKPQGIPKSPALERQGAPRVVHATAPTPATNEDDVLTPKDYGNTNSQAQENQSSTNQSRDAEPIIAPRKLNLRPSTSYVNERKNHSLLHSYGADFSSSFQSLPTATTPRTPGVSHTRTGSAPDAPDMVQPSSTLLRTIIDSLPVQIFTAAPGSGALTWVNSKFLVYRGQDSRLVLQEPWQAMHPEDREGYMELWNKSLRTGNQMAKKVRLLRFDGTYRWFFVRAAPLKDKRQNIVHWIGTNMDFHEQHLAEMNSARQQEIAASEAKYRALANSSPQIVFAATRNKGIIFCNSQWVFFSGQPEAEALGLGFMDHVHADDIAKCRLPTIDADGSAVIDAPLSLRPEPSDPKSPSEGSETSWEAEKVVTSPGNVTSSTATGMPQARLSKLASTGILKVTKDIDGRPSYSTEVRLRSKDGTFRWHLVRILLAEALFSKEHDEDTWYGTCTDINDHKLLEQTLKETMDAKSRFLSNMSHEIRTPLNGITGMVNFLIDSSLTAEQMEHVNIIRSSTEGLRDLINDILDLSKVEAGMITLTPQWFTVRDLIEDVNDLTSGMAVDKGLQLNYVLEDEVPDELKGDRFRIRQVLLNVIGNAIKFTDVGEVFVICRVLTDIGYNIKDNETLLQFQVMDTGKGFTEKEAEYLFKRFSQIDGSSTRQHGGTGLGLAISMQLVELHGGKMKASSVPGKGSTFTFTVKFQVPSEDDRPTEGSSTPGTLTSYNLPTPFSTDGPPAIEKRFSTAFNSPGHQLVESPLSHLSDRSHGSPAASSASSDPSVRTIDSVRSQRSSASSFATDKMPMKTISLSLPPNAAKARESLSAEAIHRSMSPLYAPVQPPMYSILVACPLEYSRQATVKHLESTLPTSIPHQITARENLDECMEMLGGDDPVIFTHVILVLNTAQDNLVFMEHVLHPKSPSSTSLVIISDLAQKREIVQQAPHFNYDKLKNERRLLFVYKPLKPSKISAIFDPKKERGMLKDSTHDSAQQVAVSQKQVFEELKRRIGNKGFRVLLVEDNKINQTVLLKFLGKIAIDVETVLDGVQCTDKVLSQDHGYYSIILCDLHMPNKDGYQTCREIRKWEKRSHFPHLPIIALSANVLGDVYAKCVEAGFNSYVTKPVDFKVLSDVMNNFLDPEVKGRPHEFMKMRKGDR